MAKINKRIGFLGCGNMGTAILSGLLKNRVLPRSSIFIYDVNQAHQRRLQHRYKVKTAKSAEELLRQSQVILLAVKPQTLSSLNIDLEISELKRKTVISILAGTKSQKVKAIFKGANVVRVMPNLGAMVGEGITAIAKTKSGMSLAKQIFRACGEIVILNEKSFDVVTAVSGSGPAYYFYLTELLIQSAVASGIKQQDAIQLAIQTAAGSVKLMQEGDCSPAEFRRRVTSKGGTTEAALKKWKKQGFHRIFQSGIQEAIKRGKQLSRT